MELVLGIANYYVIFRLVNILPNSIERVVGIHGEFPIESVSLSHDGALLATSSHEECVKFWKTPDVDSVSVDCHKKRKGRRNEQHTKKAERRAFYDDL